MDISDTASSGFDWKTQFKDWDRFLTTTSGFHHCIHPWGCAIGQTWAHRHTHWCHTPMCVKRKMNKTTEKNKWKLSQ